MPQILTRHETLGYNSKEVHGSQQQTKGNDHRGQPVSQYDLEGPLVEMQHPVKEAPDKTIEPAMMLLGSGTEEAAAQHRRETQGNKSGHQDRHADRNGKFAQQPAQDSAHEEHRDKSRHQRQGHRQNGESDLLGSLDRGFEDFLALLYMTDDILEHHDRVVNHETDAQRERHQGEIIQAVVQEIHHGESADNRHRQSQAGDDGGGDITQEKKNYEHDKPNRQKQGKLHVLDRRANRLGAVEQDLQLHRRRNLLA